MEPREGAASCYTPSLEQKGANLPKLPAAATSRGDLNNTSAARVIRRPSIDLAFASRSLAIPPEADDLDIRRKYRPFILDTPVSKSDWISRLELSTVAKMAQQDFQQSHERLRILVLFGSLRRR